MDTETGGVAEDPRSAECDRVNLPPMMRPVKGSLPLTEGEGEGGGLILADTHTSADRRLARRAQAVFHAVLATDLNRRGAATATQLYQRLSWFMLPFEETEIKELLDSARRAGVVESVDVSTNGFGEAVKCEWRCTEQGEKLKRPRAMSLPDLSSLAFKDDAGLTTVFGSVRGLILAALPFLGLFGIRLQGDAASDAKWAALGAGLAVLLAVLGAGVAGDLGLRAAALSWPRLARERGDRLRYQLSYLRMAVIPAGLVLLYLVAALLILAPDALTETQKIEIGGPLLAAFLGLALWARSLRRAWARDDADFRRWGEVWTKRASQVG